MNFFGVTRKYDFARGPMMPGVLLMALPLIGIALLKWIPGIISSVLLNIVANYYGSSYLAGIVGGMNSLNILNGFSAALMMGAAVVVARSCGKNDARRLSASVNTVLLVSVVTGVILAAVYLVFALPLAGLHGTYAETMHIAAKYIRLNVLNVLLGTVSGALLGCMYGMGDTVRPLLITAVQMFLRSVIYVVTVPILKMGMYGFALADTFAALVGVLLGFVCFALGNGEAKLNLKAGFHAKSLAFIIVIALTLGVQNWPTYSSLLKVYGGLSTAAVAAFSIAQTVGSIGSGIIAALVPMILAVVSQCSGAGDARKAFKSAAAAIAVAVLPALMVTVPMLLIGPFAARLFYNDMSYSVMEFVPVMVRTQLISGFFTGAMLAVAAAIRGRGATVLAAITSVGAQLAMVFVMFAVMNHYGYGLYGACIANCLMAFAGFVGSVVVFIVLNIIAIATQKPLPRQYAAPVQPYAAPAQPYAAPVQNTYAQPVQQPVRPAMNFDPMTGRPLNQGGFVPKFDPMTGKPLQQDGQNGDDA